VSQMAVRALGVIRGFGMVPVADDAGGKNQQRNQRQRNSEYAKSLPHGHFVAGPGSHIETETKYKPLGDIKLMLGPM
jgi:hypothetical protein